MEKIKSMSVSSLYSKILRAVLFIVVALIFSISNSCGNSHSYPRELVVADSLCDNNPDSALTLIRKIKTDQLSDNESWYLRLLKIKQKVKSNENFTDDKEAKVLVDHFEKDGDKNLSTCTVEHPLSACHPIAYFPLSNPSFHFSVDYCCSNNSKCSASLS